MPHFGELLFWIASLTFIVYESIKIVKMRAQKQSKKEHTLR
jgi:hypothetical protein